MSWIVTNYHEVDRGGDHLWTDRYAESIPRKGDHVILYSRRYTVVSVEWYPQHPTDEGVIVYLAGIDPPPTKGPWTGDHAAGPR